MSYDRVIPRDLFNEADLLKSYGRLALLIHEDVLPAWVRLENEYDGEDAVRGDYSGHPFDVSQNLGDGSTSVSTLSLYVGGKSGHGDYYVALFRPLNCRRSYGLRFGTTDDEVCDWVFEEDGALTEAFTKFVVGRMPNG